ncbi:hypothetical protein PVAG01_05846 [Phlyctema vagabunda]|uniref:Uncharacterized protein n=1 Tax=Phlyctema vagabunda TaxID=108571 RepID=A0ABR4PED9_9HELO
MWAVSPMMEAASFEWTQYNSDTISKDLYGPVTPETRKAWNVIWDQGSVSFPAADLEKLNKTWDQRNWWRLPPPLEGDLLAFPERSHQLHCLSFLYLFAYRDSWDVEGITKMSPFEFKFHVRHCSLVLFRIIKCKADVSPVLFQRDESDFGVWKTIDVPHKYANIGDV